MNQFITLSRIMRSGVLNFFRNAWLSIAATAIMVVTLNSLLGSFIMNMSLNNTIKDIVERVGISVYLDDATTDEQRQDLERSLRSDENVVGVDYISKTDALNDFLQRNIDEPDVVEGIGVLGGNPFPASLKVKLRDLSKTHSILAITEDDRFTEIINGTSIDKETERTIKSVADAQRFITRAGFAVAGIFAAISILIIFNTIRMAIFTRSEEIRIMKLIGATNWFIRGPFVFEAILYGVVAGVIALTFSYFTLTTLGPKIGNYILFLPTIEFFNQHLIWITLSTLCIGIMLGVISSLLAMSKYLKLS